MRTRSERRNLLKTYTINFFGSTEFINLQLLPFISTLDIVSLLIVSKTFASIKENDGVWKQAFKEYVRPYSTFPHDVDSMIATRGGWYTFMSHIAHAPAKCHSCHMNTTRNFSIERCHRICNSCLMPAEWIVCAISSRGFYAQNPVAIVDSYQQLAHYLATCCDGDTIVISGAFSVLQTIETHVALRIVGKVQSDGKRILLQAAGYFPIILSNAPIVIENLSLQGYSVSARGDHSLHMCALDIRSSCVIRGCWVSTHGSGVLIQQNEMNEPNTVLIEDCEFQKNTCAGVCFYGNCKPQIISISENLFRENGWVYQDDENPWGRVLDLYPELISKNTLSKNRLLRLM
jgi:hypothetical protein